MIHKSLHLQLPSSKPFDRDNWFESFVGNFVLPLLETGLVDRYWFSRYQDSTHGKHVRFRFFTKDYQALEPNILQLTSKWSVKNLGDEDNYTLVGDLGTDRFLGDNHRQTDREKRANLVFDFLYTTSRLFVDFLSHHDVDGYWYLENETRSGQNFHTAFESLHHLYCNITEPPIYVVEATHPSVT
ncbi:MAG: lantibiotic dehydratase C-terminal domain-containing protein, partial [Chloroflexota bacterium]